MNFNRKLKRGNKNNDFLKEIHFKQIIKLRRKNTIKYSLLIYNNYNPLCFIYIFIILLIFFYLYYYTLLK